MFAMTADWWEIIVRVVAAYAFLLVLMRISGKRQLGQLTPMDLLTVLLISETVSPALTASDDSLTAGALASGTLFGLALVVAAVTYRSALAERVLEGTPALLIQDGVLRPEVMARERITAQELEIALRRAGIQSIESVLLGMVEPDGDITFIKREG